jgi:hypothetical protein
MKLRCPAGKVVNFITTIGLDLAESVLALLDDLAMIGATVEPAGDRLILRAGSTAIPASLVSRVREAKGELVALLTENTHVAPSESAETENTR